MSLTTYLPIAPSIVFDDVSGVLAGEQIGLYQPAFNFKDTAPITVSASRLNEFVVDVVVENPTGSTTALTVSETAADFTVDDMTSHSNLQQIIDDIATGSAKATVAKFLTGNPFGDIGELENDTEFENLITADAVREAIANAMSPEAVVSAAENILNNAGLSTLSDSTAGREPSAPFEAGDKVQFNMVLRNGTISLQVDPTSTGLASNTVNGVPVWSTPAQEKVYDGSAGEYTADNAIVINGHNNCYTTSRNRYSAPSAMKQSPSDTSGYVYDGDGDGVILVTCQFNLA